MSLILRCFLGMRREQTLLVIDPVIPASLDGLRAELEMAGRAFEVSYRIASASCGSTAVNLNGTDLPFSRGANPYRIGTAEVPMEAVLARLMDGVNRLCIQVG
jgi:cellobiose phosphorylase